MSFEDAGKIMGISRARCDQLERSALRKIIDAIETDPAFAAIYSSIAPDAD